MPRTWWVEAQRLAGLTSYFQLSIKVWAYVGQHLDIDKIVRIFQMHVLFGGPLLIDRSPDPLSSTWKQIAASKH